MAIADCDKALDRFRELKVHFEKDLSESDTRAKMIDPVFFECLGWTERDIRREPHVRPGYIDYVFSVNNVRRFVLEAKKQGESFVIPKSFSGRSYRINGVIWDNKKIREAIEQTQEYCINSGVNYGIISNGHQYIIFEGFKKGDDWKSGQCVVFHSLEDIEKNFGQFWDILNRNSVRDGSLRHLISMESYRFKYLYRPVDRIHIKDSKLARNNLSHFLTPFLDQVFDDITGENQLNVLKNCYVTRKQYQDAIREMNRHFDTVPHFAKKYNAEAIIESATKAGTFQDAYEELEKSVKIKVPRGSLILLMGGIGSGKTTFIHHFFNCIVVNREKTLWFYVNFLDGPDNPAEIEGFILDRICSDFRQKYANAFAKELSSLRIETLRSDIKDIVALFSLLMLRGYSISLVLDNADQQSYVTPKYQDHVILAAKRLTDTLGTITILTLREESFFKSMMSGVLDAFSAPAFHISSPLFEDLVRIRIEYVIRLLGKSDDEISTELGKGVNLGVSKGILKVFFEIIENSLRSSRRVGNEILRFIQDISGNDMRLALYFFRTFLISGNTDVDEMLDKDSDNAKKGLGRYQIPFHHVIKSIVLEHSKLYQVTPSKIMNLFDFDPSCGTSHFLSLRILNYLYNGLSSRLPQGNGFMAIDGILNEGERMGISESAIGGSLRMLAFRGLVEFENQSRKGYAEASLVRITNAGMYYLEHLVTKFVYLDLVWMDTPISDRTTVENLLDYVVETKSLKRPEDLEERFCRTEVFLEYLKQMEKDELCSHPEFKDSPLTENEFMPKISESYEQERKYIVRQREIRAARFGDVE